MGLDDLHALEVRCRLLGETLQQHHAQSEVGRHEQTDAGGSRLGVEGLEAAVDVGEELRRRELEHHGVRERVAPDLVAGGVIAQLGAEGMTNPTAFAAPVVVGMMERLAARARRRSL